MTVDNVNKSIPLLDVHQALGAKLAPFAGFLMPIRYAGDAAEHRQVRAAAGLFDVSHMGEFLVRGEQALPFLQYITTNDVSKIPVGKAQYNCLPNEQGGIVDDLIVYHLEDDLYMVVVNAANIEKDWKWFEIQNERFGAQLQDISGETALLALSGPKAAAVMQKLTDLPVADYGNYEFGKGKVAGQTDVLVCTTGYTGERTYELFCRNGQAHQLWDAIMDAGQAEDVNPAGLAARDTLRLEMGYMLYGNDINDETSPIEAGLGWITKFKKGDFISRETFLEQKENGTERKLVAFETTERGIPRQHYQIQHDGEIVGQVTSGTHGPSAGKGIGMGYVKSELAQPGQELQIVIREKPVAAVVVKPPFVQDTSVQAIMKKKKA